MNTVCLTDPMEVVRLKEAYRKADELHEEVKSWPARMERDQELANIQSFKHIIAARLFAMNVPKRGIEL